MKAHRIVVVAGLSQMVGIAGTVAPVAPAQPMKEAKEQVETDFKSIVTALMAYKLAAGNFPTTKQGLKALVEKPVIAPIPRRWAMLATKVPLDPWKSPYQYRFPGSVDPKEPEILSSGPDRLAGTADDLSSQKP